MTSEHDSPSFGQVVRDRVVALVDGFADLMAGIARFISDSYRAFAPLAFAVGCQSGEAPKAEPPPPPVVEATPAPVAPAAVDDTSKPIGKFSITFYYVIGEDEVVAKHKAPPVLVAANDNIAGSGSGSDGTADAPDGELAAIDAEPPVTLYTATCEPIAEVSHEFASQIELQGTGKLHDGRVLNIAGACRCGHSPCFTETASQWGTAGTGHPLSPFRTVAVDPRVVKLGSLLYVPLLEGRLMPGRPPWGGFVHDGCVLADDTGGGIDGKKLDLFVGRKAYFLGLSGRGGTHSWARDVDVFDGSKICQRKGRTITRIPAAI
jgi:3D (Asp-Asp-Asp) domain-containing protein